MSHLRDSTALCQALLFSAIVTPWFVLLTCPTSKLEQFSIVAVLWFWLLLMMSPAIVSF